MALCFCARAVRTSALRWVAASWAMAVPRPPGARPPSVIDGSGVHAGSGEAAGSQAMSQAARAKCTRTCDCVCSTPCVFYVKGTRPLPREVLQCGRSSARAQAALPRVALPPLAATTPGGYVGSCRHCCVCSRLKDQGRRGDKLQSDRPPARCQTVRRARPAPPARPAPSCKARRQVCCITRPATSPL